MSSRNRSEITQKKGAHVIQQNTLFTPVMIDPPADVTTSPFSSTDFSHAIYAAQDILPDVPYDAAQYEPQNPVQTPDFFPSAPNPRLLQPEFFRKYDLSTLFYLFFYFPGTPQQFFAGRELKQRKWRYHNKYQTWFLRCGEPTETTGQYEIGCFNYFDHHTEEGWCIRQRENFKFEYEYLEND